MLVFIEGICLPRFEDEFKDEPQIINFLTVSKTENFPGGQTYPSIPGSARRCQYTSSA